MSLSYEKLKPVLIQDPVTDVNNVHAYAVLQGGSKISWKTYTSTSIASSSIQWSCPPPSGGVIIDRAITTQLPIRLIMNGTVTTNDAGFAPTTSLLNAGHDAPRFMPLSGSLESLQVNINNDSLSIPMSDVIHALTRYNICEKLRSREYSTTPSYPDQSFNYSDLFGTNRNPLGNYGNGEEGTAMARGGFPFTIVPGTNLTVSPTTGGTAATATVDFVVTEPLFLSPMFWGASSADDQGFYNVTSFDLNFSFLANAGFRMWSHDPGVISNSGAAVVTSQITSITVQFNSFSPAFSYPNQSNPQMLFKYITPNVLSNQLLGPQVPVTWPYFDIQRYPTNIGTVAFGSPVIIPSNNIQLNSIPRRIYIYARPNNQSLQTSCTLTDCYLAISNVSIQWANQSTLMSQANQVQLFQINNKNHGSLNWTQWSGQGVNNSALPPSVGNAQFGGVGGILALEFGTDIQLDQDESPGVSKGQYQLQVTASFANMNSSGAWDAVPMTFYIITVSEGTFTIPSLASAQHQLGVLTTGDILNAQGQPGVNYRRLERVNGGDFFGALSNFGNKLNDFLKESKIISEVGSLLPLPGATLASKIVSNLGYGRDQGGLSIGGIAVGGCEGGRRMTKAELRKNLMHR